MSLLRVYLFGAPRLERDGESIPVQRRKAVALCAYLAVTNQPHSRDTLATLLWPEYDQSSARSNLRRDLSRLKDAVGEDILFIDRTQIGINPEAELWLDVAEFERRMATVQQHNHTPQQLCPECRTALNEAVALYTDDFLAGFHLTDSPDFDEWQFFQREGLQQLLAEALQSLIGWYASQEEFERGVEYGRRWLALDPLHEPAHRQLMRLYAWAGQQAAALRQYEECVRLLKEELDVEPEAKTEALYNAIKTRQLEIPGGQGSRGAGEQGSREARGRGSELPVVDSGLPAEKRYIVEELMASGGHGEVYRGLDRLTGQPVVVKRLKPELVQREPQFVVRFIREGEALRQLNHPNIVQMLATFEQDGEYSIVMEYVPGGSLRQMLEETPQLPLEQALDIALELADALSRAHHLHVIHRDIKPDNVLLAADGTPRLTDFGIARLGGDDARLTQTGNFIGSPAYMSPEALRGEELDARSDTWSFGVLLYEMLAGCRPFSGEQLTPVLVGILNEPVPDISNLRPDVPPALADLLAQMLVKERDHRIPSVRLVAAELEAIRSGRPRGYVTPAGVVSAWGEQLSLGAMGGSHTKIDRRPLTLQQPQGRLGDLPKQSALFIGRQQELADIQRILLDEPDCRLLTLVGPGGIGKTRLALEAASRSRQSFPDGTFFVPLAPLTSAEQIVSAIAESLHLHFYDAADPRQQLLNYLHPKKMLLVMDNFEHLLEGATLVSLILESAAGVDILATSREALNLSSESVYTLSGLSFPGDETAVASEETHYSAVELLLEQARQLHPDFKPGAEALRMAARIARLVQGMPLAIVLAVHWLEMLSLADIADEIAGSLDILETEMRDVPLRQRSVRAVFDSSWKRLAPAEQAAFMRLAVFRGGFTRRAAQEVAGAGLRTLRALVNKSLIVAGREGRFEVHELLRQYGDEKLTTSGEMDSVRAAHSAHYLGALQEWEADLKGRRQVEALSEIEVEWRNIYAAWNFALQRRDYDGIAQALESIHLFCDMRGRYQEGIEWFGRAREQLAPVSGSEQEAVWGRIVTRYGFLQVLVPASREKVIAELREGLAIAQKYNNKAEMGLALQALGIQYNLTLQDPTNGLTCLQQALALFRSLDDHFYIGRALFGIGLCHAILSDLAGFSRFTEEGLAIARAHGNKVDTAVALGNLAEVAFGRGEYAAAENYSREAVAIASEIDSPPAAAYSRAWLGFAYLLRGDMNTAGDIIKKSLASAENISHEIVVAYAAGMLSLWAGLNGDYEAGRQYGEESRSNPSNNTLGPILARWGLAISYEGLQQVEAAWNTVVDALVQTRSLAFQAPPLWLLPVAAVLLARRGEKVRAVEVLALSSHHPLSPQGWMEQWRKLAQVRADLEKQLGREVYRSAWERGQTLDLAFVVGSLLAEVEPEQSEVRNLPAQSTPFVGREGEYGQLKELIQATGMGRGHVVLIEGEPGVGKSRLVQEALDYARSQGIGALAVKCYEAEQEMLYEVVMELVAQALEGWPVTTFAQVPRLSLAEIALLVPEVATYFPGLPAVATGFDEARQARLFRALAQFLSAPAAANGLILVVDDIQWADSVTRQFLHHMAHHVAGQPLLLILVYRSAEAAVDEQLMTMIHAWQRQAHVSYLSLERLSAEDTAALVAAMLTSAPQARELGQWLHRESDGNPFFLVSILESLQERGLLAEDNGQLWQKDIMAIRRSAAELTLPDALRQLVRDRLRRIPVGTRQFLDVAAVLGGRFDLQTLQAVTGKDRLSLLEDIEQLLARRLLREEESGHRYDFSHDKIREVVYHDLSAARRRLLHSYIAEAVESLDPGRVGMLAEHYEQGEVWDKAITYLARTASRSRQLFAVREALRFYDRALALARTHPDAASQHFVADLYEQRGETRAHAGEFEAAADDLQAALAAVPADDAGRIRDVHIKLGMTYRRNDRLETAIAHLEAALKAARSSGDEHSVADALYHLGTAVWSRGDNHQAREYHEEAVAICRRLGLKDLVAVQALHGLGEVRWQAGHPAKSLDLSAESLEMARQIGDKSYEVENLTNMALVLQGAFGLADYRRAEALLLEALPISREAGLEWHRLPALAELAGNYSLLGDYQQALATMHEALELAERLGSRRLRSYALDVRGTIWQELNQLERAIVDHAAGVRMAEESGNGFWLPRLKANLAIDRLRQGDLSVGEEMQVVLEDALGRELEGHAVRCLEGLAEWALAKGEPQEAQGYITQLQELAEAGGMREVVARATRWHGEAQLALSRWEAATSDLEQALALAEELGRPRLVWSAHAALARLHRAQGKAETADSHEAQVQAIVERIAGSLPAGTLREPLLV